MSAKLTKKLQAKILVRDMLAEIVDRLDFNNKITEEEKLYRYRFSKEILNEFVDRFFKD